MAFRGMVASGPLSGKIYLDQISLILSLSHHLVSLKYSMSLTFAHIIVGL